MHWNLMILQEVKLHLTKQNLISSKIISRSFSQRTLSWSHFKNEYFKCWDFFSIYVRCRDFFIPLLKLFDNLHCSWDEKYRLKVGSLKIRLSRMRQTIKNLRVIFSSRLGDPLNSSETRWPKHVVSSITYGQDPLVLLVL